MPRAHIVGRTAAASSSNADHNSAKHEREGVVSGDLCVGCIVWLPRRNSDHSAIKCCKSACCGFKDLDDKGYNHPVVVLAIRQRENSTTRGDLVCKVACVTTFGSTTLSKYEAKRKHLDVSIPIYSPDSEDSDNQTSAQLEQLHLEKRKLFKQSYIRLKHVYQVPASSLRNYGIHHYRAYKLRLSKPSYCILMRKLDMAPEPFEDTDTLFETADYRLRMLSISNRRLENPTAPRNASAIAPSPIPLRLPQEPHVTPFYDQQPSYDTAPSQNNTSSFLLPQPSPYTPYTEVPESPARGSPFFTFVKYIVGFLGIGSFFWYRYFR